MEHRCGSRHEVDIAVYARSHGGVVSSVGFLRNISAGGGFLLTKLPLPLLARVALRLIDADGNFGARLEGHVVRRGAEGVGIEWSDYVPDLVRTLTTSAPAEGAQSQPDPQQLGSDPTVASAEASALPRPAPRPPGGSR